MEKPTFKEALQFWTKLGFISFGGPAGQIAIMYEYLVEKKKWISKSRFMHSLNYCMILPGPEAQQLTIYIGWLLHGVWGGLAAGILFVLPSMFILLGLSLLYVSFGNIPWIYAMFMGLKPVVLAIIMLALVKIGKKALISTFHYVVASLAFLCIFLWNIPFPLIIIGTIFLSELYRRFFPHLFQANMQQAEEKEDLEEGEYYINKHHFSAQKNFSWKGLLVGFLLWLIPFGLFYAFSSEFPFWKTLSVFFTQAAFVTFGGAYSVLPYVAQVSVEKYHWLTSLQMIDGLALGETTPGPLIIVLAFVGFMAGYNHFTGSLLMGTLGLFMTTFYTFLPSFLFIFIGAPLIERTQNNPYIKNILGLITASVVGLMLNLSVYLGKILIFPKSVSLEGLDYFILFWVIVSCIAMYRFKIGMITWMGISVLLGLIRYFLSYNNLDG